MRRVGPRQTHKPFDLRGSPFHNTLAELRSFSLSDTDRYPGHRRVVGRRSGPSTSPGAVTVETRPVYGGRRSGGGGGGRAAARNGA